MKPFCLPCLSSILTLAALTAANLPSPAQAAAHTYEWTFDQAGLAAALGSGTLTYADSATPGLTSFGTTDGVNVPHMGGQPATYMHVPVLPDLSNGYLLTLTETGPNGSGAYVNQYTMIMDLLLPSTPDWTALFNTNPQNGNDADFYIADDGSIGIGSIYSDIGLVSAGTWYRIAFVADLSAGTLSYYINGNNVRNGTVINELDGRWSLYSNADPGPDVLLFNEGDTSGNYTHELYVAGIAFVDRSLNSAEIASLGGPSADGIFARRLQIQRFGDSVIVNWRPAPNLVLQKTSSLDNPNWETLPETLGADNYAELALGTAFYRLISQ